MKSTSEFNKTNKRAYWRPEMQTEDLPTAQITKIQNKSMGITHNSVFHHKTKGIMVSLLIATILFSSVFLSSCDQTQNVDPILEIGMEGTDFAESLVTQFPFRKAYSVQEKQTADLIVAELEDMKYKPVVVTFGTGEALSQNIIIKIPGTGFTSEVSSANSIQTFTTYKQVIIGVHYDTILGIEDELTYPNFDGIQNASGVGVLISIAKELKSRSNGYDVILVFFGAGGDNFAGAVNYFGSMTKKDISKTDVMYCIDSIYAGDKLYAHSGINSIKAGVKYEKRRKLYEISDVAIANTIDLRFNESDLDVDVNGDSIADVYREITATKSDYSVFDNADIPCVFMESYDYYGATQALQVESKNPSFGATGGVIRGTDFDSMALLKEILSEERLETRIKNSAFLVVEAIAKGMYKAVPVSSSSFASTSATGSVSAAESQSSDVSGTGESSN
jgi:alkaline phosphatase isozyme conversion protein